MLDYLKEGHRQLEQTLSEKIEFLQAVQADVWKLKGAIEQVKKLIEKLESEKEQPS